MPPDQLVSLVPIAAIVMGVGARMLRTWSLHQQEMARIRQSQGGIASRTDSSAIEALRQEIMQLRDTTTQYDVSVERTMSDLRNRVAHIESRMELPQGDGVPAQSTRPKTNANDSVSEPVQQITVGR